MPDAESPKSVRAVDCTDKNKPKRRKSRAGTSKPRRQRECTNDRKSSCKKSNADTGKPNLCKPKTGGAKPRQPRECEDGGKPGLAKSGADNGKPAQANDRVSVAESKLATPVTDSAETKPVRASPNESTVGPRCVYSLTGGVESRCKKSKADGAKPGWLMLRTDRTEPRCKESGAEGLAST